MINTANLLKMDAKDRNRFWSKVIKSSGCWGWAGSHKPKGYARFWFKGMQCAAHRVSYFIHHGSLTPDLEIDHTCRTLDCVNPEHLEAVTPKDNRQRRINHYQNKLATTNNYKKVL